MPIRWYFDLPFNASTPDLVGKRAAPVNDTAILGEILSFRPDCVVRTAFSEETRSKQPVTADYDVEVIYKKSDNAPEENLGTFFKGAPASIFQKAGIFSLKAKPRGRMSPFFLGEITHTIRVDSPAFERPRGITQLKIKNPGNIPGTAFNIGSKRTPETDAGRHCRVYPFQAIARDGKIISESANTIQTTDQKETVYPRTRWQLFQGDNLVEEQGPSAIFNFDAKKFGNGQYRLFASLAPEDQGPGPSNFQVNPTRHIIEVFRCGERPPAPPIEPAKGEIAEGEAEFDAQPDEENSIAIRTLNEDNAIVINELLPPERFLKPVPAPKVLPPDLGTCIQCQREIARRKRIRPKSCKALSDDMERLINNAPLYNQVQNAIEFTFVKDVLTPIKDIKSPQVEHYALMADFIGKAVAADVLLSRQAQKIFQQGLASANKFAAARLQANGENALTSGLLLGRDISKEDTPKVFTLSQDENRTVERLRAEFVKINTDFNTKKANADAKLATFINGPFKQANEKLRKLQELLAKIKEQHEQKQNEIKATFAARTFEHCLGSPVGAQSVVAGPPGQTKFTRADGIPGVNVKLDPHPNRILDEETIKKLAEVTHPLDVPFEGLEDFFPPRFKFDGVKHLAEQKEITKLIKENDSAQAAANRDDFAQAIVKGFQLVANRISLNTIFVEEADQALDAIANGVFKEGAQTFDVIIGTDLAAFVSEANKVDDASKFSALNIGKAPGIIFDALAEVADNIGEASLDAVGLSEQLDDEGDAFEQAQFFEAERDRLLQITKGTNEGLALVGDIALTGAITITAKFIRSGGRVFENIEDFVDLANKERLAKGDPPLTKQEIDAIKKAQDFAKKTDEAVDTAKVNGVADDAARELAKREAVKEIADAANNGGSPGDEVAKLFDEGADDAKDLVDDAFEARKATDGDAPENPVDNTPNRNPAANDNTPDPVDKDKLVDLEAKKNLARKQADDAAREAADAKADVDVKRQAAKEAAEEAQAAVARAADADKVLDERRLIGRKLNEVEADLDAKIADNDAIVAATRKEFETAREQVANTVRNQINRPRNAQPTVPDPLPVPETGKPLADLANTPTALEILGEGTEDVIKKITEFIDLRLKNLGDVSNARRIITEKQLDDLGKEAGLLSQEGNTALVFNHPTDPSKVIKIPLQKRARDRGDRLFSSKSQVDNLNNRFEGLANAEQAGIGNFGIKEVGKLTVKVKNLDADVPFIVSDRFPGDAKELIDIVRAAENGGPPVDLDTVVEAFRLLDNGARESKIFGDSNLGNLIRQPIDGNNNLVKLGEVANISDVGDPDLARKIIVDLNLDATTTGNRLTNIHDIFRKNGLVDEVDLGDVSELTAKEIAQKRSSIIFDDFRRIGFEGVGGEGQFKRLLDAAGDLEFNGQKIDIAELFKDADKFDAFLKEFDAQKVNNIVSSNPDVAVKARELADKFGDQAALLRQKDVLNGQQARVADDVARLEQSLKDATNESVKAIDDLKGKRTDALDAEKALLAKNAEAKGLEQIAKNAEAEVNFAKGLNAAGDSADNTLLVVNALQDAADEATDQAAAIVKRELTTGGNAPNVPEKVVGNVVDRDDLTPPIDLTQRLARANPDDAFGAGNTTTAFKVDPNNPDAGAFKAFEQVTPEKADIIVADQVAGAKLLKDAGVNFLDIEGTGTVSFVKDGVQRTNKFLVQKKLPDDAVLVEDIIKAVENGGPKPTLDQQISLLEPFHNGSLKGLVQFDGNQGNIFLRGDGPDALSGLIETGSVELAGTSAEAIDAARKATSIRLFSTANRRGTDVQTIIALSKGGETAKDLGNRFAQAQAALSGNGGGGVFKDIISEELKTAFADPKKFQELIDAKNARAAALKGSQVSPEAAQAVKTANALEEIADTAKETLLGSKPLNGDNPSLSKLDTDTLKDINTKREEFFVAGLEQENARLALEAAKNTLDNARKNGTSSEAIAKAAAEQAKALEGLTKSTENATAALSDLKKSVQVNVAGSIVFIRQLEEEIKEALEQENAQTQPVPGRFANDNDQAGLTSKAANQ